MTSQELQTLLGLLTPIERRNALQILMQKLSRGSQGIAKTPEVIGGDACIANTRLPVWLFVSLRQQGATDAELLRAYPQLSAADLVSVWAYADAYPEEIAIALQEQEAVMYENCDYPYDTDSAGRSCEARSAYSKPGGCDPICYERDRQ